MHKCPKCGVSRYKVKVDECSNDESTKKDPQKRCYGIFLLFQGLSDCLLMEMMKKILHGIQMGESIMECSAIQFILPNGRKFIVCIQISRKRQEILGLDLPLMELMPLAI